LAFSNPHLSPNDLITLGNDFYIAANERRSRKGYSDHIIALSSHPLLTPRFILENKTKVTFDPIALSLNLALPIESILTGKCSSHAWGKTDIAKRKDINIVIVRKYRNFKWNWDHLTITNSITPHDIIFNLNLPWNINVL